MTIEWKRTILEKPMKNTVVLMYKISETAQNKKNDPYLGVMNTYGAFTSCDNIYAVQVPDYWAYIDKPQKNVKAKISFSVSADMNDALVKELLSNILDENFENYSFEIEEGIVE